MNTLSGSLRGVVGERTKGNENPCRHQPANHSVIHLYGVRLLLYYYPPSSKPLFHHQTAISDIRILHLVFAFEWQGDEGIHPIHFTNSNFSPHTHSFSFSIFIPLFSSFFLVFNVLFILCPVAIKTHNRNHWIVGDGRDGWGEPEERYHLFGITIFTFHHVYDFYYSLCCHSNGNLSIKSGMREMMLLLLLLLLFLYSIAGV